MRIKRVELGSVALRDLLVEGTHCGYTVQSGIPPNAQLVEIRIPISDSLPFVVSLWLTHPTFPEVPNGSYVASSPIIMTREVIEGNL